MRMRVGSSIAAIAAAAVLTLSTGVAFAADPMTNVAQGADPAALPGAKVFGDTPASTPETVSFVLRAQNLAQLQAGVVNGESRFLTVGQFAATYGQSPATIAALEGYLARFGIRT